MTATRRSFLEEQLRVLEPFDVVTFLAPRDEGLAAVEVERSEDGTALSAEIGAKPPLEEGTVAALATLGFLPTEDAIPTLSGPDPVALAEAIEAALSGPLGIPPGGPLDVHHGSRRAQVEMERKVQALRERTGKILEATLAEGVLEVDEDDDFTFPHESTRVWVAVRALSESGPLVVRVMAPTNVGVVPTPQLGLFLAETSFGLPFGRFSLDARNGTVWFEESLLGEYFADEELRFAVGMVASTADRFDDQIASMFGGQVFSQLTQDEAATEGPGTKPGSGGYL